VRLLAPMGRFEPTIVGVERGAGARKPTRNVAELVEVDWNQTEFGGGRVLDVRVELKCASERRWEIRNQPLSAWSVVRVLGQQRQALSSGKRLIETKPSEVLGGCSTFEWG